jgi:hypothetical protein
MLGGTNSINLSIRGNSVVNRGDSFYYFVYSYNDNFSEVSGNSYDYDSSNPVWSRKGYDFMPYLTFEKWSDLINE